VDCASWPSVRRFKFARWHRCENGRSLFDLKTASKEPRAASKPRLRKPARSATAFREAVRDALDHKVDFMSPESLTPYERNPLQHPADQIDQIVASIKEFGFTVPILIDENDMILAGHGRHAAALKLKMKLVPVIRRTGLSEAQKRAYIIADNKITMNAVFDWALITGELEALKDMEFNLDLTGFRDFEYDLLLEADWRVPEINDRDLGEDHVSIAVTLAQKKVIDQAVMAMQNIKGIELETAEGVTEICRDFMKRD